MNKIEHKCCGTVWPAGAFRSYPCSRNAKVERDGKWYCGTHDPVAVAAKQSSKKELREREWLEYRAKVAKETADRKQKDHRADCFPDLLDALKLCQKQLQGLSFKDSQIVEALELTHAAIAKAEGES